MLVNLTPGELGVSQPSVSEQKNLRNTLVGQGSKYSNHLNTRQVGYSNGRFELGSQMVQYTNGGLNTRLKKACLWSNGLVFKWSVKLRDNHLNTTPVRYSDVR